MANNVQEKKFCILFFSFIRFYCAFFFFFFFSNECFDVTRFTAYASRYIVHNLEREPVAGGVQDPGVVVGALHAGVQADRLPGQLAGVERAGVGQGAERPAEEGKANNAVHAVFNIFGDFI